MTSWELSHWSSQCSVAVVCTPVAAESCQVWGSGSSGGVGLEAAGSKLQCWVRLQAVGSAGSGLASAPVQCRGWGFLGPLERLRWPVHDLGKGWWNLQGSMAL